MSALNKFILIIFLYSSFSKAQYANNFLINTSCYNRAGEKGLCKFYYDCPHMMQKFQKKEIFLEDITECSERSIICCIPEIPAPHDHTFERISERKCKEYSEYTKSITVVAGTRANPEPLSMVVDKCKHLSVQLVVGGKEAHEHEFPHQALLGYFRGSSHKWVCGGSLVSPKFVLTAAHCKFHKIEESGRIKVLNITNVKIGMTNLKNDEQTRIYRIFKFIKHENYNSFTKNSDIALVELTTNVQLSEKIHPICLPTKEYGPNTKALVTGFGRTENSSGMSDRLMKAVLNKYEHSRCEELYTNTFIDGAKMLCFGRNDSKKAVDSCNGDSGGPLQIYHESVNCSYIQIGIVSFGNQECTIKGFPGVYVNVFHFIDWIEKIVWPN